MEDTDQIGSLEGQQASGSGQRAICNPAILNVEISHGGVQLTTFQFWAVFTETGAIMDGFAAIMSRT